MELTLQLHHGGLWHDAATLVLERPEAGIRGPSRIAYEMNYFVEHGAIALAEDIPVRDARALSVRLPIDLEDRAYPTWPAFLLDLLPQGHQRIKIATHLGLNPDAPSTEIHLLMRAGGAPVGNVRIKEAHLDELERLKDVPRVGTTIDDMLGRSDRFLEVADRFSMIASGSSGLQGDWPKIAMTQARDGLWYPDPMVADAEAQSHVIIKLLRSNDENDRLILEAEAPYSAIAQEFGLAVHGISTYSEGVLVIPRFDRARQGATLIRYGQESLVSALGIAEFGHQDTHENYLHRLRNVSTSPLTDVIEYVLRDVLNLAMGNPDNHGRNTALTKTADGGIRLAPLFDFAPMRLSTATMNRSTKWECMRRRGRDYSPDWKEVCEAAAGDNMSPLPIMEALLEKEELLRSLPDLAVRHGVPQEVTDRALVRHIEIADGISELRKHVPSVGGP